MDKKARLVYGICVDFFKKCSIIEVTGGTAADTRL